MKDNLKLNLEELKKDVKGLGKGLLQAGASALCAIKDTLKVPVSIIKDVRDGKEVKAEEKVDVVITETTEAKTVKVTEPKPRQRKASTAKLENIA